jgi:MFS family permease
LLSGFGAPTIGNLAMIVGPLQLFRHATQDQRRTLLAAALGWMFDAFDAMLYALVLAHVMRDLSMSKASSGFLYTLTLLASGIGGIQFGSIADRLGRKRALMLSILTYSICSFGSGLATSVVGLAVFRFLLGLGMGGGWNTGAALVAETWPTSLRAKALSVVQSSWAFGYALAAFVAGVVLQYASWRYVFFIGVAPVLLAVWIQKKVPESELWLQGRSESHSANSPAIPSHVAFGAIFRPPLLRSTIALLFANFFGLFAWWGLFTWLPPYLSLPASEGGRGFSVMGTTTLLVFLNLFGMFPGYTFFGWAADRLGRRRAWILYTFVAALLVPVYAMARAPWLVLVLGCVIAFFGTGFFSGSGIIGSEIFPTSVRARALGFTYDGARTLSSVAPFVIGKVGQTHGLGGAFYLCAGAFLLSAIAATQLPETRGKALE